MDWIPVDKDLPPEFKNVLATLDGYDEPVIAGLWKKEWFLINDFEQKFKGDNGAVKVVAWMNLPKIYKP